MPKDDTVQRTATLFHLIIAVIAIITGGGKVYYDVRTNTSAIETLKKKSEKNNETISEIKTKTAVIEVRVENIDNRTVKTDDKIDKIYEAVRK